VWNTDLTVTRKFCLKKFCSIVSFGERKAKYVSLRLVSQRQIRFCSIKHQGQNDLCNTTCRCSPVKHSWCFVVSSVLRIWSMHNTGMSKTVAASQACAPRQHALSSTGSEWETCSDWLHRRVLQGRPLSVLLVQSERRVVIGFTFRPVVCLHLLSFTLQSV
jgi:hypothetical protein